MAEIVRLRKFEKPPEQLLKDLAEHKDLKDLIVIGTYEEDGTTYIDAWHNNGNATTLVGMLMRTIIMVEQRCDDE